MKKNMKQLHTSALAALGLAVVGLAASSAFRPWVETASADSTTLQVYPVNSRLSFRGKLGSATTAESTMAILNTTYNASDNVYSTSSAQLQTGDKVTIGPDGKSYFVSFTSNGLKDNQLPLSTPLGETYAAGTPVVATMSGQIKVTYELTTAGSGTVQILVPAIKGDDAKGNSADGMPDSGGFDFGTGANAAQVSCDGGTTWAGNAVSAMSASGVTIDNAPYHLFSCEYTSKQAGDTITLVIKNLINPTHYEKPQTDSTKYALNRSIGSMDAYAFYGREINNNVKVNETITYVGFSNGVKLTVRVMPQLTLELKGIAQGQKACGETVTTTVGTSPYEVDFGSLNNTSFTDAAQKFTVTTNAPHGYVITAIADDQMRVYGEYCPDNGDGYSYCIPGYGDNSAGKDRTTDGAEWKTENGSGFGYTLYAYPAKTSDSQTSGYSDNYNNADDEANVGISNLTTGNWRAFADRQAGQSAVQLFNNLSSTNHDELEVCYRIMSSPTNLPGKYMSTLTYTITASF